MNVTLEQNISLPIHRNPLMATISDFAATLFESESQRLNKQIGTNEIEKGKMVVDSDKGYKCIHLEPVIFLQTLENVLEQEKINYNYNLKFLDVGCGVGQKVYLASRVFKLDAYGLELRQPFIDRANEILNFRNITGANKVFQANALEYDKYGDFDIIYFYCPIADSKLEEELEKRIAEYAKKGAIVIGFLSRYFNRLKENGLKEIGWERKGILNNYDINYYFKKNK